MQKEMLKRGMFRSKGKQEKQLMGKAKKAKQEKK
jgi:hypothetical protein